MKTKNYFSFVLCSMLATSGYQATAAPGPFGSPSSTPVTYKQTDAPQETMVRVRPPYADKTVAAIPYVNKTLVDCKQLGDAAVGVLPEFLLEAGFQPVEASTSPELKSVLDELKYGQSENVNSATAAKIGGQLGAKYVFVGEINSYRVVKPEGGQGLTIRGMKLNLGGGALTYDIQLSGRLIDVETRMIVAAKSVAHSQTFKIGSKGSVDTPWGSFAQEQNTTVEHEIGGKVLRVALNRLVSQMVTQLNARAQ